MNADVTFLMSTWNAGPWIRPAIESVLAQTHSDWQMVVVDDQSSDGTPGAVEEFGDERIRLVRLEQNLGQTRALNRGLAEITTPWVARLDQDDVSAPERVERQLAYVRDNPRTVAVGSYADLIDEQGAVIGGFRPPTSPAEVRHALYAAPMANPIAHSAVMFRAEVARKLGGYPSHLTIAQDYGLWARLAERGEVANVGQVLVSLRRHPGQASGSRPAELRQLEEMIAANHTLGHSLGLTGTERRDWMRARTRLLAHRSAAAAMARDWPRARADLTNVARTALRDPRSGLQSTRIFIGGVRNRLRLRR
jgi:GT2 family glycosyltransferase